MKFKTPWKVAAALGAIILVLIMSLIGSYNGLVDREAKVDQAAADLEVSLQRRFDLIPNLVAGVKGAMAQEKAIIDSVTEARTRYASAGSSEERIAAAGQVESALSRLLVVMENYPQLQSIQTVRDLQVQLEGTENRVAQARRDYNAAVTDYNRTIKRFPRSMFASMFGFSPRKLFVADAGAGSAPVVDFGTQTTTG